MCWQPLDDFVTDYAFSLREVYTWRLHVMSLLFPRWYNEHHCRLSTIVHLRSYELKELGNCSRSRRHVLTDAILFWCIVDFVFRRCHHSLGAVSDRLPRCWVAVCPSRVLGPGTGTYSGTTTLSTIIRHLIENESFFLSYFSVFPFKCSTERISLTKKQNCTLNNKVYLKNMFFIKKEF